MKQVILLSFFLLASFGFVKAQDYEITPNDNVVSGVATAYKYDRNGNLTWLYREAKDSNGNNQTMDFMTYNYEAGTNQLTHINDNRPDGLFDVDIDLFCCDLVCCRG